MKVLLTALLLILPISTLAESEGVLNSLLAPGPLMGGHAKLEKTGCFQCHDAGKGVSLAKCLDCHKEIRHSVEIKKGFHGLTSKSCTECHSEHKGRDYNSVAVNTTAFDHAKLTGYELVGKHAEIKCQDCHREKRKGKYIDPQAPHYFGLKADSCQSCHKKDDVHFFTGKFAKKDCNACHGLKSWKSEVKFNHNADTNYKLVERHAELRCTDCHLANKAKKQYRYQWPTLQKSQCLACHQDVHKTGLSAKFAGGECLKCHTQTHWKIENFAHKITGYDLSGKHASLKCVDCHKQASKVVDAKDFKWAGLKSQCSTCHKDVHKFGKYKSVKYGDMNQCSKCHEESSWKRTHDFVHNKDTRYAIDGKHLGLKCEDCHLPKGSKNPTLRAPAGMGVYHWQQLENKNCENCHANPHIGEFKGKLAQEKCSTCHVTEGWKVNKKNGKFDHSQTRFTLTGAHLSTSCQSCHEVEGKKVYKFTSSDQRFCVDCHENIHARQFGEKFKAQACDQCHSTKDFKTLLPFDHTQTEYPLVGAHTELKCSECHKSTGEHFDLTPPNAAKATHLDVDKFLFPELKDKQCQACHEDYHKGQLGGDCQKCHNDLGWKKLIFDHNKQSRFPLVDKHAVVDCNKCHKPIKHEFTSYRGTKHPMIAYKPLKSECVDCHKDPHHGSFGKSCTECHTAQDWKVSKDFHKNFTLTGVHQSLDCTECHRDGRKLSGLSQECMICHQKDDIHHGTLPNCKECHLQTFWDHSNYKHSLTRFPLRGVHRTLDCNACHYRGGTQNIYQGLNNDCASCHRQDAINATSFNHVSSGNLTNCQNCHHNQFSFH